MEELGGEFCSTSIQQPCFLVSPKKKLDSVLSLGRVSFFAVTTMFWTIWMPFYCSGAQFWAVKLILLGPTRQHINVSNRNTTTHRHSDHRINRHNNAETHRVISTSTEVQLHFDHLLPFSSISMLQLWRRTYSSIVEKAINCCTILWPISTATPFDTFYILFISHFLFGFQLSQKNVAELKFMFFCRWNY